MDHPIFVTVVYLICGLLQNSSVHAERQCRGASFSRHFDKRFECGIFKTFAANPFECHKKCAETMNCLSVNVYKDDKGTEVCELIRKSKKNRENDNCLVDKPGIEHNELEDAQTCSLKPKKCNSEPKKKALPEDWYQLGSTAFKLFPEKLSWYKAVNACKAAGARIAQIHSKEDNQFVAETLMLDIRKSGTHMFSIPKPLAHWKLDGTDSDVEFFGDTALKKDVDDVTTVLDLPGTTGSYAQTPSFDIRKSNFTISLWAKTIRHGYMYGRWGAPYHFAIEIRNTNELVFLINKQNSNLNGVSAIPPMLNRWTHYTAVWDRTNAKATVYVNGYKVYTKKYNEIYTKVVPGTLSSKFDVGLKRDSFNVIKGSLSHLHLFDRALESEEVARVRDSPYMGNSAWIGIHDINTEGTYQTDTNESAKYFNFASNQIKEDVQDCVSMRAWDGGKMDVNDCSYTMLPYICMKQV